MARNTRRYTPPAPRAMDAPEGEPQEALVREVATTVRRSERRGDGSIAYFDSETAAATFEREVGS